jgi:4-hydroxyproline epimerase
MVRKRKIEEGRRVHTRKYYRVTIYRRIEEETTIGAKPAIVPSIEGWAMVYGYNTIKIDDDDPYAHGFQVL